MELNDRKIAEHVTHGGFTGEDRVIGVAIVLAESGGRSDARGDVNLMDSKWGPSIGLFQIHSLKAERGTGRTRDELANVDPATNARHARQVHLDAGGRWTPWSTFTSGSYRRFLDRARQATGGGPDVHLPNGTVHVVRAGETLSGIARANGVTLEQLRAWNPRLFDAAHHGGSLIQVGEAVALSAPGSSGHAGQTFVVRPGDTVAGIASAHGLTLDQLRARNPVLFDAAHQAGNLIHPGELIRL